MPTWERKLIVRANGECRVVSTRARLRWDEVSFYLTIDFPSPWGRNAGHIELSVPEVAVNIAVGLAELPEPEEEKEQ